MPSFFKGKSINYHTDVTVSKTEQTVIWITALIYLVCFIVNMFLFKSVWLIVLIDFIEFLIMFGIFLLIIFSPKHKEERIKNTIISKND